MVATTVVEPFTLTWLSSLISSVVGAAVNERTKPKTSIEIAKKRALSLYDALREVEKRTSEFVTSLDEVGGAMLEAPTTVEGTATVDSRLVELRRVTSDLRVALEAVKRAVAAIDPQLEIHQPEIVRGIDQFSATRGFLIESVEDLMPYSEEGEDLTPHLRSEDLRSLDQPQFQAIAQMAKANLARIQEIISAFRKFLAQEFEFKESF